MVHVMLNPPKKARKGRKKKLSHKGKKRRDGKVCMPKSDLRHAKSLRRLKRKVLRRLPKRKIVCISRGAIRASKSLKRLKHKYVGTKYGFAAHPRFGVAAASGVPSWMKPAHVKKARRTRGGKAYRLSTAFPSSIAGMSAMTGAHRKGRKGKKGGKKTSYLKYMSMLPLERKMAGVTLKDVANNPKHHRNFPLPTYALNDAIQLDGLRDGLTAGYRPSALKAALPVVGGLVANSVLSALVNKLVSKQFAIGDKWKNPVGLAVGLGTAGLLSVVTKMIAPRYAKHVFLGGLTQVAWDGYQNYVAPSLKKKLGLNGLGCGAGSETFGLWCDECDRTPSMDEALLSRSQVQGMPARIESIIGTVMPPAAMTMQSPPNVSAPDALSAKINGQTVPVERLPSAPAMGDFLTPNQVASATSLGNTGDMSSYL